MMPFAVFVGRKPLSLSARSGEALPLPVSNFGESIDGAEEGIRGRVEDVLVSELAIVRGEGALADRGTRLRGGATRR